jgi:hypothetical protein
MMRSWWHGTCAECYKAIYYMNAMRNTVFYLSFFSFVYAHGM